VSARQGAITRSDDLRPSREIRWETLIAGHRTAVLIGLGVITLIAVAGWVGVLSPIDERRITDVGIVSVIPPAAYAFVLLLASAFVIALRVRPTPQLLLALQLVALVFMLYGAPAVIEDLPRFVTGWLHVGFTDAIARTGELFPNRDARFDWPAFFVLWAFLANAAGAESLLPILPWAPVAQGILYLLPLYLIARSASGDLRLVWLTLWIFTLANWVGQDYFSPQGLNLLLMLTVVAVLLTWFRAEPTTHSTLARWIGKVPGLRSRPMVVDPRASTDGGPEPHMTNRQQMGLVAIIALLFGMSVASHQLTPFAMIGGLLLLVMAGRLRPWGIPVLMIVLVSTWLVFMATTFLDGRVAALLSEFGRPDQFAESNVAGRLRGSAGHVLVVQARLGFTLGIWVLALVGGLRRLRAGRFDLTLALLAMAPFGLVLVQGYGGEMILRVFLFGIPFMAFFAAAALTPTPNPASWRLSVAIVVLSVVMAGGQLFTRFGNEMADLVTREDYEAAEYVKTVAEPGAMIASANSRIALEYRRWEEHRYPDLYYFFSQADLTDPEDMQGMLQHIAARGEPGEPVYVILTRSNRSHAELNWGLTRDEWSARVRALDDVFEVLYRNRDATVWRWTIPDVTAGEP
jgi:hypothetical protein